MDAPERQRTDPPPALSSVIDAIMANPELISTVASALGRPITSKAPPPRETPPEAEPVSAPPADLSAALSLFSHPSEEKRGAPRLPENDRSRLLCALKPYVNPHRRDAIDTLLRFSQMTELLKLLPPRE